MKYLKKPTLILLAVLLSFSALQTGLVVTHAVSYFDDGDYRYAVQSDDTLAVAAYLGSETDLILPERVGDRMVTGIYSRCFENTDVTSVVIPRDYTSIGAFAFNGCTQLTDVELPSGLQSIGIMAFYGCTSLASIDFSYTALTSVAFAAFSDCSALTAVSLPDSVTSLGDNAFCNCTSLSSLRLSRALTAIPEYAFYHCALGAVSLPESVQVIGEYAFAENASLTSADLSPALTKIGAGAFENDTSLGGVFVTDAVTEIGANAFSPMTDSADFAVRCFEGSAAAAYFEEIGAQNLTVYAKLIGDVNFDGELNVVDVTAVQKHLAGLEFFDSSVTCKLADVNGDGVLDITDATAIQRIIAGLVA